MTNCTEGPTLAELTAEIERRWWAEYDRRFWYKIATGKDLPE